MEPPEEIPMILTYVPGKLDEIEMVETMKIQRKTIEKINHGNLVEIINVQIAA